MPDAAPLEGFGSSFLEGFGLGGWDVVDLGRDFWVFFLDLRVFFTGEERALLMKSIKFLSTFSPSSEK